MKAGEREAAEAAKAEVAKAKEDMKNMRRNSTPWRRR